MKAFMMPYNPASEGCKRLAEGLNVKRIKREGSKFKGNANKLLINWGCSELPQHARNCGRVLNTPESVRLAANKLHAFQAMAKGAEINLPEFTANVGDAKEWGSTIVARTKLTGHSGEGIVLHEPDDEDIVNAPLYVRYIPKKEEYRVHVVGGVVTDIQRKARRHEVPNERVNWKIRNMDNGFIFARNEDKPFPEQINQQAVKACEALGLDFGAVDIIFNEKKATAYVLEVNTAPGLSGTTLDNYIEQFKAVIAAA